MGTAAARPFHPPHAAEGGPVPRGTALSAPRCVGAGGSAEARPEAANGAFPEGRPGRALGAAVAVFMALGRVAVSTFSPLVLPPGRFAGGPLVVETLKDSGQKLKGFGDF